MERHSGAGRRCLYLQYPYKCVICEALMVISFLSHAFVIHYHYHTLPTGLKDYTEYVKRDKEE